MKYSVVLAGTPDICILPFTALFNDSRFSIQYTITNPDKPIGRKQILTPPPVKTLSQQFQIPCYQPEKFRDIEDIIKKTPVDILLVMAYGKILPQWVLESYRFPLNIHASLLPMYRGASPIQSAIYHQDKQTGISIMHMVQQMDAGKVYMQHTCDIHENETSEELSKKLSHLASLHIGDDLVSILTGHQGEEQNENNITFCHKIEKKDGELIFHEKTARELYAQYLAYTPWPGGYFYYNKTRIKIVSASITADKTPYSFATKQGYFVPEMVIPEGKNKQHFSQYCRSLNIIS